MKRILTAFILLSSATVYSQSSTQTLLQGKWQSTEDKTNMLWFDGDLRKETNDGTNWDSEEFVLGKACQNDSDASTRSENGATDFISCIESDLCWEVTSISTSELTLTYTARGNMLMYKRVK